MKTETTNAVKEEVEKMFKSGIIRVEKYNEWLSNIVPICKKNGKIRVCVDYRDLNKATPKDVYPMPVADMLIDVVARHEMLSFMDDTIGYHQIPVAEADIQRSVGAKEFVWEPCHQEAFDIIKEYLANPPVLVPPKPGIPLKLYISASESSIVNLLAQDDTNQEGRNIERAIYYLSRTLLDVETRYSPIERLCLALYFAGCKLWHYMLSFTTVVTGQAFSDFILHHHIAEDHYFCDLDIGAVYLQPWTLYFDGSNTDKLFGTGVSLVSSSGGKYSYSFQLEWKCTNNQAEYEAVIIGLEMLLDLGAQDVDILGDSLLVINQLRGKFQCISFTLVRFLERALELLDRFATVLLEHIPRKRNFTANELAHIATGISLPDGVHEVDFEG
ncbi:hypothetical protein ACLB2K_040896 [Fragaria x ananassa]